MKEEQKFFTCTEILRRNPILSKRWTPQSIGYLFKLQIVSGIKKARYNLINEDDVLKIFYFSFPSLLHPSPVA